jgi:hypothetical protein
MTAGAACPRCRPESGPSQAPPGSVGLLEPWLWQPSTIGRRHTTGRVATTRHYLVPPFGEWIRLAVAQGAVLVLGRDESCDVRISSPSVSRRHAELRFRGDPARAYVTDLETVNGTRLNGAPVRGERTVGDQDVLRLGDVTAVYRVIRADQTRRVAEPKPSLEQLNATVPLDAGSAATLDGLTGDARFLPMDDLLGRLLVLRASGTLTVQVDGTTGVLVFKTGTVASARFAGREGDIAVKAIGALTRGQFRFAATT